jgi:hypothetical protein
MTFNGKGPLLSAADADGELRWRRVRQAADLCAESLQTLRVEVADHNQRGLVGWFMGHKLVLPYNMLDKPSSETCVSDLDLCGVWSGAPIALPASCCACPAGPTCSDLMRSASTTNRFWLPQDGRTMVGKTLEVAMVDCDRYRRTITVSQKVAETYKCVSTPGLGGFEGAGCCSWLHCTTHRRHHVAETNHQIDRPNRPTKQGPPPPPARLPGAGHRQQGPQQRGAGQAGRRAAPPDGAAARLKVLLQLHPPAGRECPGGDAVSVFCGSWRCREGKRGPALSPRRGRAPRRPPPVGRRMPARAQTKKSGQNFRAAALPRRPG